MLLTIFVHIHNTSNIIIAVACVLILLLLMHVLMLFGAASCTIAALCVVCELSSGNLQQHNDSKHVGIYMYV
jgi:uncharacterized membrane protein YesL